ncbi:DUF5011 domain-containing protein [Flavobacterium sp. CYK-55]|uniref:immunoglobulin-like domain-containing protein n=1 Tax=Flavobacterium sp. CYK-55 TaxID=2835529 RepID=UPI001BD13321|nr:immunoglobulin-like domain-containing protein [Flavobacterium sp. CYK-55]MBS7786501.1 DUF5011 domain-containing protein [Flavobacterium sp. CYK-55]
MKRIFLTLIIASSFIACDDKDDTASVSRITNYPIITVLGDDPIYIEKGGEYVDPGAIAMEGENEIEYTTSSTGKYRGGSLDANVVDEYNVTYTATNKDGFDGSATRKVIVYKNGDLVNSIEGLYKCTISRNGVIPSNAYRDIEYIYIWKNDDGTYGISDAFGGWYEYGRALGLAYITPGGIINAVDIATNSFTFPGNPLSNDGFGGVANITDVNVDAATKKIVLTCTWAAPTAYTFVATLTQVQP